MEANARGGPEPLVAVVDAVEAPERWQNVVEPVEAVGRRIEGEQGHEDLHGWRRPELMQDPQLRMAGELRRAHRGHEGKDLHQAGSGGPQPQVPEVVPEGVAGAAAKGTPALREAGSATRATLESAFLQANLALPQSQVVGDTEALKHAVAAGLGVACVSPFSIRAELEAGRLQTVRVSQLSLKRPLSILLHAAPLEKPVEAFLSFLRTKRPRRGRPLATYRSGDRAA